MKTHRRHARREQHRVFLGDAHVVIPLRHRLLQSFRPVPLGIAAVMPTTELSFSHSFTIVFAEHVLPRGRRAGLRRGRRAGLDVVRPRAVEFFRMLHRHFVALALLRQHMQHHRLLAGLGKFQRVDQQRQIVPVNRPQITQAQFLENQTAAPTRRGRPSPVRWALWLQRHFRDRALQGLLGLVAEFQREFARRNPPHQRSKSFASWL